MERVPDGAREAKLRETARNLLNCGPCGSDMVQPLDWQSAGPRFWRLVLRCPNCEATGAVILDDDILEFYDVELEKGVVQIAKALSDAVQERIGREVTSFANALRDDQILPEDF